MGGSAALVLKHTFEAHPKQVWSVWSTSKPDVDGYMSQEDLFLDAQKLTAPIQVVKNYLALEKRLDVNT